MFIDSYDSPDAEALVLAGEERVSSERRARRELIAHGVGAVSFLAAATALAAIAPWHRSLSSASVALVLLTWLLVERVKFPVAAGWASPTMLAFVPALFLLPTPVVPLVATIATVLRQLPELLSGRTRLRIVPVLIADTWFTIGPVLVLALAGTTVFAWHRWPVYVAALAAQLAFDLVSTVSRCWIGEGISPRVQLPLLAWVYAVDVTLAPLGLVIAAASLDRPGLILLALSPMGMLYLFARERQQRLEHTLALSTAYRGTALLLGDVVEADDHYTGLHSRDVVDLSLAVADELGLDGRRKRDLEFAALLHDVGKIRIPKEIINKPGPLEAEEWEIVRRHTIEGEQMLKQVGGTLASVGRIIRHSHERYDGDGYPDGLAGDAIPIESRIVAVCDAYSAMTTTRSYRSSMTQQEALAELLQCSGTQFDPAVVAVAHRLLRPPVHQSARRPRQAGAVSRLVRQRERRLASLRASIGFAGSRRAV